MLTNWEQHFGSWVEQIVVFEVKPEVCYVGPEIPEQSGWFYEAIKFHLNVSLQLGALD